jgi:hypothetical protein
LKSSTMLRKGQEGQAVLLVVLALGVILCGVLGLAIDGAHIYAQFQLAQCAADAAAEAAALSIFHGTNVTGAHPFATVTPASSFVCTAPTNNLTTPCVYAQLNGFGTSDTVTVSFPTTVSGVTTLSSNSVPAVSVTVQRVVPATLMQFLGTTASTINAVATAGLLESPLVNCMTSLDSTANNAISAVGNANINLTGCGIAVDSNSGSALSATGNVTIQADSINVVGGVSRAGNVTINPNPTTGAQAASDPLASVPAPSFNSTSSCNFTGLSYSNGTVTLSQGTYCGGLSVTGNANITFNPGTYIFRGGISLTGNSNVTFGAGTYILQGGGFSASGNVSMTGSGITLYNTFDATHPFAPISITGNFTANLSAPTSGPLQGMLFFEDRNAPAGNTDSFTGNSNETLTGALYFPRSTLSYTGNSSTSPQNVAIIADKISIVGNANFHPDPTQAAAPHQLAVALVR